MCLIASVKRFALRTFMVSNYRRNTGRLSRLAWLAGGAGFIWGIGISVAYAVADMFGPYRHLYCMIPREKYNEWGLILVRMSACTLFSRACRVVIRVSLA